MSHCIRCLADGGFPVAANGLHAYPDDGRAFHATYQKRGYLTPDQLVVLSPCLLQHVNLPETLRLR